jgi:hydrogenase nickel incorporation protein HypA/HybF
MHELHQARLLLQEAQTRAGKGRRVRRLTVIVGEASGHWPEHLAEDFAAAAKGTPAEGAVLELLVEKLAARCAQCGGAFEPKPLVLACPACGSAELTITAGQQVRLDRVEAQ